jgi:RNA polymerase sigma-70 factor (ECF subfamily)
VSVNAASSSPLTDQEVVSRVVGGDGAAFEAIVRRYGDRLHNTLYRLVGSAEDARDLAQDTFVKAYENLEHFRGGSSLYTWLFRIAVNTALSHRRKNKRMHAGLPGPDDGGDGGAIVADPAPSDPAREAMSAETQALVQRAIDSLDDEHRTVVVLRDIQHCDYQEIARILEVPTGTVKSRLHRARLMLRERLGPLANQ